MNFIDLKAQQEQILPDGRTLKESIKVNIDKVVEHGKYILGPEVNELEEKLRDYVGTNHCICTASGTDALTLALLALNVKPGDEIITTPFTFISSAETIALLGAIPVFTDIDPKTYNIDPEKIESYISKKTKAILAVSLYGQPARFDKINKIANKYNIKVIEDGAQSFGSTQNNFKSGNLSSIGTTSFFPSKPFGCYGDGGACFTNDDLLAEKIRVFSKHGQTKRYFHTEIGINGRFDTMQAAILLAKLPLFEKEVSLRQKIGTSYTKKFNEKGLRSTPFIEEINTSVYAQYTLNLDNRDDLIETLKLKGIPTAVHYPLILPLQPAFNKFFAENLNFKAVVKKLILGNLKFKESEDYPNALKASQRVISLPMHPWLSNSDQDTIVDNVYSAISN